MNKYIAAMLCYLALTVTSDSISNRDLMVKQESRRHSYETIKKNLEKQIRYCKRKYPRMTVPSKKDRRLIAYIADMGERLWKINHKDLLAIATVESCFKKKAKNPNYWGKARYHSTDYGYFQHNSRWVWKRFIAARPVLRRYGIKYQRNVYDTAQQTMAAVMFLHDIKKSVGYRPKFWRYHRYIVTYNTGARGYYTRPKKRRKYWKLFFPVRRRLL